MYVVTLADPTTLSVNYMWLPTWIGMNRPLLLELDGVVASKVEGLPVDEAIEKGHDVIVEYLCKKFAAIPGLREYLNNLKSVQIQ